MATTRKILGQVAPSATSETVMYTVPASTSCVVSSLSVCNRAGTAGTFRVSVSAGGVATANKDYLAYGFAIAANDALTVTRGLTLAAGDVVRVYASSADMSFSIFGEERV